MHFFTFSVHQLRCDGIVVQVQSLIWMSGSKIKVERWIWKECASSVTRSDDRDISYDGVWPSSDKSQGTGPQIDRLNLVHEAAQQTVKVNVFGRESRRVPLLLLPACHDPRECHKLQYSISWDLLVFFIGLGFLTFCLYHALIQLDARLGPYVLGPCVLCSKRCERLALWSCSVKCVCFHSTTIAFKDITYNLVTGRETKWPRGQQLANLYHAQFNF